jgi:hypothetical protein
VATGVLFVFPPLPQAATTMMVAASTAALARKVMGLLRVMSSLRLGVHGQSQRAAMIESRDA